MGKYVTTTAMEVLLITLTFDTKTSALVTRLIDHAENEVEKHMAKRYDISSFLPDPPPLVETLTETLTEGYVWIRTARGGKEALAQGKILIDGAMENLKAIVDGDVNLVDSDGDLWPEGENLVDGRVLSNTEDYAPTFNEDDPLLWKVDDDKLDDIDSERN